MIVGVFVTGREFWRWSSCIQFADLDLFFDISVLFRYTMEYQEGRRIYWIWICVWKQMDHRMNSSMVGFSAHGYIPWLLCCCRFLASKSFFPRIEIFLISNKTAWSGYSSCGKLFWKGSPLSVISVSFKKAESCNNKVLVTLVIRFLNWFWNGFTTSNENESSGLKNNFSPLSLIRMENCWFSKWGKTGWQSSFCEWFAVPCLTQYCTGLL